MKIAVFSDSHMGYPRFEEDSYVQTEMVLKSASEKADVIICAGDIFDTKVPKLETLKRAVEVFNKASVPIYAIFGNHERRARDFVNPAQLLSSSSRIRLMDKESLVFEKDGEKVQIFGVGSVPEDYATEEIGNAVTESFKKDDGAFSILVMHQSVKGLVPGSEKEISLEFLETLPFDLIVNGHIHETMTKLGGKFLVPGSTVVTQLKKSETVAKGYFLYDTKDKKTDFIEIESRKFFYEELDFKDVGGAEVREGVKRKIADIREKHPAAVIAIKINGTLKEGLTSSDIKIEGYENVFIENRLNLEELGTRFEMIRDLRKENLSVRDLALKELRTKTEGKLTLFDTSEIFEKLLQGTDETLEYLEKCNKKAKQ